MRLLSILLGACLQLGKLTFQLGRRQFMGLPNVQGTFLKQTAEVVWVLHSQNLLHVAPTRKEGLLLVGVAMLGSICSSSLIPLQHTFWFTQLPEVIRHFWIWKNACLFILFSLTACFRMQFQTQPLQWSLLFLGRVHWLIFTQVICSFTSHKGYFYEVVKLTS